MQRETNDALDLVARSVDVDRQGVCGATGIEDKRVFSCSPVDGIKLLQLGDVGDYFVVTASSIDVISVAGGGKGFVGIGASLGVGGVVVGDCACTFAISNCGVGRIAEVDTEGFIAFCYVVTFDSDGNFLDVSPAAKLRVPLSVR